MRISYYKSPKGVYWTANNSRFVNLLINGEESEETFSNKWKFLEGAKDIKKVYTPKPSKKIIAGYVLYNEDLASDKIPEKLSIDEVGLFEDCGWDDDPNRWKNYTDIKPLYKPVYETLSSSQEEVEAELNFLGCIEFESDTTLETPKYRVYRTDWKSDGVKDIDLSAVARWSELDKMLTPEFALVNRPCKLTSKQTFDIVRYYVQENIDPKEATITSDYEFCFTVKKRIHIKPYTNRTEILKSNGKCYARPRFRTTKVDHKLVEVFEMTSKEKSYRDYTPIEGFVGESLKDLAENVKLFLDELMEHINKPIKQCECCDGTGHILPDSKHARK